MPADSDLAARLASRLMDLGGDAGARLPSSERGLSEHFAVSRGQVREALAVLEALRVVERRPKSGISLTPELASAEALALFARAGVPLAIADVEDTVEMRKINEITAVRLACERATLDNFDRLRAVLADAEARIAAGEPIQAEDKRFHLEIVHASQNSMLFKIVNIFYLMSERRMPAYFSAPGRSRRSHAEHTGIFDAIARRDTSRAMTLMAEHLAGAEGYWEGLSAVPLGAASAGNALA